MAKIINPLFSVAASGSIGKALVFRNNPAAPTARLYSHPTGDPTVAQARYRLAASHAASLFNALTTTERDKWQHVATALDLPIFALYMREFSIQAATLTAPPLIPAIFP